MNDLPGVRHIIKWVRELMAQFATWFVKVTKGKVSASQITWVGLVLHIPAAWFIAQGQFFWAVAFLTVFGLFDSLDGAVARATGTASPAGMVLDAFADRLKEVLTHAPLVYFLAQSDWPSLAVIPALTLGMALSTNFLKAKAEVAYQVRNPGIKTLYEINRMFSDGSLSFEVRTVVVIVGMLMGSPILIAVCEAVVAIGVWQRPRDLRLIVAAIRQQ